MSFGSNTFPVLRWVSLLWMVVWFPAYFRYWGWTNLLHLCDVAVILSFIGIWWANPLMLSSQAVSSLAPGLFWILDVGWRLATGRFLIGGTDYMWDARYPLWVRLLSSFHVGLPLVLLWTLRRVGYDKRGFALQAAIAAVTGAHPMKWMQPCVEHREANQEDDRIGANDAGRGSVAEPLLAGCPRDCELESVDQSEDRPEGEIGDHHRAQRAAHCNGVRPCRAGEQQRYDE